MEFELALSFDDVLLKPQYFSGTSRSEIDIGFYLKDFYFQIPIIAANMPSVCGADMAIAMARMGGLGIIHRMQSIKDQAADVEFTKSTLNLMEGYSPPVAAAVGIGEDWKQRVGFLMDARVDILCIDVAHGAQSKVLQVVSEFRKNYPNFPLIAGNIASLNGVSGLNVSALKVGVGGGSVCTTRIKTGCGVPTFQSILDCCNTEFPRFLIADGGMKNSGDIVKALAAGANAVMLGSLLAGTDEAPGEVIKGTDGKKYKIYRGAASYGAKKKFFGKAEYIEGEETLVPYRGSVIDVVSKLCEGIRSGLSYCGSRNLKQLRENAKFVRISPAGYRESKAHGLL